jgi:mRNA-degrading endonuclease RelE of RelBE toxin-antitoxin system
MSYEIERTTNFRFEFTKLNLRFKRFVEEAIDTLKETPTELPGKITHLANKKDGGLYRFRVPGCYIIYVVPLLVEEGDVPRVILTGVKMLR